MKQQVVLWGASEVVEGKARKGSEEQREGSEVRGFERKPNEVEYSRVNGSQVWPTHVQATALIARHCAFGPACVKSLHREMVVEQKALLLRD